MTLPQKTSRAGLSLPVLGFGTWQMGGRMEYDPANDDARDIAGIRNAIANGLNHIDTAEIYAAGYSEKLVGQAVADLPRDSFTIASKVHSSHLAYDDVLTSCAASRQRLGLDVLDLYYIHSANDAVPMQETARAFRYLLDQGIIKYVGVCNFTKERLQQFQDLLGEPVAVNQVHYSLVYREPEVTGLLDYCQQSGTLLAAWRPLMWHDPSRTNQVRNSAWEPGAYPVFDSVCDRVGKTGAQVALNWIISQPGAVALVKTSNPKHLADCIGAAGWALENSDIEKLRRDFPEQRQVSDAVPLR